MGGCLSLLGGGRRLRGHLYRLTQRQVRLEVVVKCLVPSEGLWVVAVQCDMTNEPVEGHHISPCTPLVRVLLEAL